MEKVIYTTSTCDRHRLEQLLVFLYSLWKNGNTEPVIVGLINCDDRSIEELIRLVNPCIVRVEYDAMDLVNGFFDKNKEVVSKQQILYTYSRPLGIKRILREGHNKILSIDTDIIVRGNIGGIWDGLEPGTIKVYDRGSDASIVVRFQGGVFLFGNSESTIDYYDTILRKLGSERDVYSFQELLFTVYDENRDKIKKIKLSHKLNDDRRVKSEKSLIWHCKHSRFDSKQYQNEFQKYWRDIESTFLKGSSTIGSQP